MQDGSPRLPPLSDDQLSAEQQEILERFRREDGTLLNIFRTLAHYPKLLKRWAVFGNHLLYKSSLPARDREIVILRTAWLCNGEYEWGQHVRIGQEVGLTEEDIRRISEGPQAAGLEPEERLLLEATAELHGRQVLRDSTWQALRERYDDRQILDIVFTVGQYTMLAMALNTLRVPLDPGVSGFGEDHARTIVLKPQEQR